MLDRLQPARPLADVRVTQLMGNIGASPGRIDAVELSRLLARHLGGTHYTVNAPVYMQTAQASQLVIAHGHLQALKTLFAAMDLALVGIGTLQDLRSSSAVPSTTPRSGGSGAKASLAKSVADSSTIKVRSA